MASKKKMARGENFRAPDCRLSFAQDLFKPRKNDQGNEKWGCTLIFSNEHRAALEKEIAKVIVEEWGEAGLERARKGLIKSPFLAGDGKEARNKTTGDLHPGMGEHVFFIRPSSNDQVPIRYKDAHIPATQDEVYSGCYGFAVLNAFAWNNEKNGDGVSFGINYFQKLRDGDRLGSSGGGDPSEFFEQIEDTGSAPEETKGGAGAGGLFG
jgi:hypothetical protein